MTHKRMKTDMTCSAGISHLGKDAAALTGWTSRVAASVAHLADAWTSGDAQNAPRAVLAIVALCGGLRPKVFHLMMRIAANRAGGLIEDGGRGSELVERITAVAAHIDAATAAGDEAAPLGPTLSEIGRADDCTCLNPAESYIHGHEPSCPHH